MRSNLCIAILPVLAGAAALGHNHLTVDTASGSPGDQISLVAGYQPAETDYTIADGRLLYRGRPAVYLMEEPVGGAMADWHGGDGLTLTSDSYAATGRLDGGDFEYELAGLAQVSGGSGDAVFAWGDAHDGSLDFGAFSDGEDRDVRSFDVGLGAHLHGQAYAMSRPGLYDVTFIAWDSNGKYADSAPLLVRFWAGCRADFNGDGRLNVNDFIAFQAAWRAKDPRGDFDLSGTYTVNDFIAMQAAFVRGCP